MRLLIRKQCNADGMDENMYITKRLWKIVKPNISSIITVTWWTLLPIVADGCRMICYGLLLLAIVNGEWGSDIVPFVVLVIVSTLMQRTCEHLLAAKKARYGNQFKGRFRSELFDKLFFLGPAFIERKTTGEIITTLWEKVEWISYYLYYYIPTSWAILLFSLICALVGVFIQSLLSLAIVFGGV